MEKVQLLQAIRMYSSTSHMFLDDTNRQRKQKSRDLLVIAVEECEMQRDRKQGAMNATREACECIVQERVWSRRKNNCLPMRDTAANWAKSLGIQGVTSNLIKDMTLFILIFDVYGPPKHFPTKKADVQCNYREVEVCSTIRAIMHCFLMYKLQMFLLKL